MMSTWRVRVFTLTALMACLPLLAAADTPHPRGLAFRVAQLEKQVAALEQALAEAREILQFVRLEYGPVAGLAGPNWILEGVNLHVRSGSGETDDGCSLEDPECVSLTGLGNLLVGYNEACVEPLPFPLFCGERTGSHNLIVGPEHSYSSFGGVVAGLRNLVGGAHAAVSGGGNNRAVEQFSSISGGVEGLATGSAASIGGGARNTAGGSWSSVSGGSGNEASGAASSVSGGRNRGVLGDFDWAAGGLFQDD